MPRKLKDYKLNLCFNGGEDILISYYAVLKNDLKDDWLAAMKSEMKLMYRNHVRTLVNRPDGEKVIENCWVFTKKLMDELIQSKVSS